MSAEFRSGLKTATGLIVAVLLLGVVTHLAFSGAGRPAGPATAPVPTVAQLRAAAKLNPAPKPAHSKPGKQAQQAKPAIPAPTDVADEPSGPLGVPGMTEGQLRAAETVMLGPEHAAEHAQMREAAREDVSSAQSIAAAHAQSEEGQATAAAETRAAGPPQSVGQWASPFNIPIFAIASVMLPTGKVMWWAYPFGHAGDPSDNTAQAWLWDPSTGQTKEVDAPINPDTGKPANLWCAGQSFLADGRVLVTGGNLAYPPVTDPSAPPSDYKGLNRTYTFNPFNETWTEQPAPAHGRWYPSQVEEPDGRTVIMSGWDESGTDTQNKQIDLFTPSPNMNGVGTLQTIAERGGSGPPEGELYPRNFVMPSGRTMIAGPDPNDTWEFNPIGAAPGNSFSWFDQPNFDVSAAQPNGDSRLWSTSVIEPGGPSGSSKVTITGGRPFFSPDQPLATSETFDDANPGAGWQPGPSLNIGRAHANTVLLPNGGKAEIGGGVGTRDPEGQYAFNDNERQMELFDPSTNTWQLGPAQAEGRAYHSTAILLPDGRVLSAGDNFNGTLGGTDGTTSDTAEIYSPPYLFNSSGGLATRPSITSAPSTAIWGAPFKVGSPDSISRAVLMAPSATTHGYDTNEREVPLQITSKVSGGVNVLAPPSATVAPPGYYMLFLLNDQGVPSVSRWIRIGTPDGSAVTGAVLGGKGKRPTLKKKGKKLIAPITCDSTQECIGKIVVSTTAGGGSASSAKKKSKKVVVAKGTFTIPAGKTRKIKLKLSKRGKALVKKHGNVKGTLTITNQPGGESHGYKVKF
jgi:Domain of unknown function (DUF1929)